MITRKLLLGSFCALFLSVVMMLAQALGTIRGRVVGPNGAPVPSASVIVTGPSGNTVNAVTGPDGTFAVNDLAPGPYTINVQMSGYVPLQQQNVEVTSGSPGFLTMTLTTGAGTGTAKVQVQGQAINIQDEDATVSRTFNIRNLTGLPVLDTNTQQLVEQMPGVTPPVTFAGAVGAFPNTILNGIAPIPVTVNRSLLDPQFNRIWQTNGQNPLQNNAYQDGVENYEPVNGIVVHVVPAGPQQEMKVSTSNYQAAEGRVTGSVLQQITRGGTNEYHGQAFWLNSNSWFNGRDFFNPTGFRQARFNYNQFGGLVGGPILRNQLFLMLSYQGDYTRSQTPTWATTPTLAFGQGNFSSLPFPIFDPRTGHAFTNNIIPPGMINPTAAALTSVLPLPNLFGQEFNYYANVPFINDGNRADARLDYRIDNSNALNFRYGLSYFNTIQDPVFPGISADGSNSRLRANTAMAAYHHIFSPETSTSVNLGFNRYSNPISTRFSPFTAADFGFTGANGGLPYIQIAGMPALGVNPNERQINKENAWFGNNTWRAHIGRVGELTFGVDWWSIRFDGFQNLTLGPAGAYTFAPDTTAAIGTTAFSQFANSYAAFLLGTPTTAGVINTFPPSYLSWQFGAWVNDRFRFGRKLTLNLGLRYDYFWPTKVRRNSFDYDAYDPFTNQLVPLNNAPYGGVSRSNLNFGPRVGIAYALDDRTVIRTGYGISFWSPIQFMATSLNPAFIGSGLGAAGAYAFAPGGFGPAPPSFTPAAFGAANVPYFVSSNFKTPYVQFYNLMIQRDLGHNFLAEVGYLGNVGRRLPFTQNINAAAPGTFLDGQPAFAAFGRTAPTYLRGTGYTSNYNSLQFNLTRRFSDGIGMGLAYTWSKANDFGAGLQPFLNNIDPTANYGPSNFDRTNVLTFTHDWKIPIGEGGTYWTSGRFAKVIGGWSLDGILTYASGLPFTPIGDAAVCGCPGNTPTATWFPNGVASSQFASIPGYLSPYSFLVPYTIGTGAFTQIPDTMGGLGRNSFRGPGFLNYNMALSREFSIGERARIDLRGEAYNIANSTHFTTPFPNVNSVNFGQPSSTATTLGGYGPRQLQLALRVLF